MSLGFDTSALMSALAEYQVRSGDKFIFVTPVTPSKRGNATRTDIIRTLETLHARGIVIEYEFFETNEHNLEEAVYAITEKIWENKNREIMIETSGGLRGICIAMTQASNVMHEYVKRMSTRTETTGKITEIPIFTLPSDVSRALVDLLIHVERFNRKVKIADMTKATGKDTSTLSRQLNTLVKADLLRKWTERGSHVYELTLAARLLLLKLKSDSAEK